MTREILVCWLDPSKASDQDKKELKHWKEWQVAPISERVLQPTDIIVERHIYEREQIWYARLSDSSIHTMVCSGKAYP